MLKVTDYKHCVKFSYCNKTQRMAELSGLARSAAIRHFLSFSNGHLKLFNDTTFGESEQLLLK